MDPQGHEKVSEAAKELLREALKDYGGYEHDTQKLYLSAFYFGNWCTDMTQLWDEVTFSTVHGRIDSAINAIDQIFDQLFKYLEARVDRFDAGYRASTYLSQAIDSVCKKDDSAAMVKWLCERGGEFAHGVAQLPEEGQDWAKPKIQNEINDLERALKEVRALALIKVRMLFGPPGGIGKLSQGIRHLLRLAAFTKFCGPDGGHLSFKSFKAIFDQFVPPIDLDAKGDPKPRETNRWNVGFRGSYYPHHHIDRWPESVTYPGEDKLRNTSPKGKSNPTSINPGLYPYMRDCIEYAAGHLADLDLDWAEPTFSPSYDGDKTRPKAAVDADWMVKNDLRLAQLGHALHVVEDFFAHSTFVEHAMRVTDDPKAEASMKRHFEWALKTANKLGAHRSEVAIQSGAKWLAGKIPDRDFTRFQRRTLKLQNAWLTSPDRNNLMNQTASDGGQPLDEEPNVVTGIFDLRDTILSIKHVAKDKFVDEWITKIVNSTAEMFGTELEFETEHGDSVNKLMRDLGDWSADPKKELFKFTSEKVGDFHQWWNQMEKDLKELKNVASGEIEPFQVNRETVREIAGPFFPEWARQEKDGIITGMLKVEYQEMQEDFVAAFALLNTGLRWKNRIVTVVDSLAWITALFGAPEVLTKMVVKLIRNTLIAKGLNFVIQLGDDALNDLIGANRIGCHSLIAKDHDYDYLADDAISLAKALDYYVVENLLRWRKRSTKVAASKVAFSGPPPAKSKGKNIVADDRKYIDWLELLEYFLRHPGGDKSEKIVTRPVTIVHTTGRDDSLVSLANHYRSTAVHPETFDWPKIALVNYGIHAVHPKDTPEGQAERRAINRMLAQTGDGLPTQKDGNYFWKPNIRVLIPDQKWTDHIRVCENLTKTWYFRVLDFNWTVIKEGWKNQETGKKIMPIHEHIPRLIDRSDLESLISGGDKRASESVAAYRSKGRKEYELAAAR